MLILKQKPRPRNLGNPKAIGFSTSEYRLELPSEEDFRKATTLIGELLKPLSAELPQTIEMAAQLKSKTTNEMSSSKALLKPLKHSSVAPKEGKSQTKQAASKQQGELPLPAKVLI